MKYIAITRPNGMVTMVRSEPETASEDPLTEHEKIINELNKLYQAAINIRSIKLVMCKRCGGSNMYQHTKTKDKCEDCNNVQDY